MDPVTVNVGRAGAASLDVVQEVEYVRPEAKIVYLLECLQKTPPPVMIFSEKKSDVDDIHEFLLQKGVGLCHVSHYLALSQCEPFELSFLASTTLLFLYVYFFL